MVALGILILLIARMGAVSLARPAVGSPARKVTAPTVLPPSNPERFYSQFHLGSGPSHTAECFASRIATPNLWYRPTSSPTYSCDDGWS